MEAFLAILSKVFTLIPYVVSGINTIHAEKSSASKTQMAQDALNIATQAAVAALPTNDATIAQTVSSAVNVGIQSVQAVHDAVAGQSTQATQTAASQAAPQSQATVLG